MYCTYEIWSSMLYSSLFSVHYTLSHIYGPFECGTIDPGTVLTLVRDNEVAICFTFQGA